MVNTLTEDFKIFIDIISLTNTLQEDIKAKHTSLTNMIKNNPPEGYVIDRTRLSGSYGKKTEINEFGFNKNPDVDIVVILKDVKKDARTVISDFYEYLYNSKNGIAQDVRIQSNSIGLKYKNIDVDIVLAKENGNKLEIASSKNNNWIESNCLKQIDFMSQKSQEYESFLYRDLMKLFKYLNKEILNNKIKSYTLEMLVHKCAPRQRTGLTLRQAFSDTLCNITKIKDIKEIKDCCDVSKRGYDDKDYDIFERFILEIDEVYKKSVSALDGNRKKWQEIFGSRFPKQPEEKVVNKNEYDKKQTPWCK